MNTAALAAAAFICAQPSTIDGDTWRCADGTRVRAWGIQAPERSDPGGPASTRALSRLITGKTLRCERKGKSYDRIVARCWSGKLDIGGAMVRGGWASDWPRFSGGLYSR